MNELWKIFDAVKANDLNARLLGSTAFRIHCPKYVSYLDSMKRALTDIDLVALSADRKKVKSVFGSLNYAMDKKVALETEEKRYCFSSPDNAINVDVFFDKLEYCHTIDLRDRIKLDYPTIPVSDLLLEKMQIVKINEKDLKDVMVLLLEHPLAEVDQDAVNTKYVTGLLSRDWGFYYTMTTNLKKVKQNIGEPGYANVMTEEDRSSLNAKIDNLLKYIEDEPKSLSWRVRAKVGTSRQWYRDVELDKRTAF
jgi:hypothetical protein